MLRQRIITALILLAILLPALFYPSSQPFCAITLVLTAAGAWEWGRLNGCGSVAAALLGLVCVLLCVGVAWVLLGAWLLRAGVAGWPRVPRPVRLIGGLAAVWLAWLAMAQARV